MHLTEALMAAFEATGDAEWLEMAERIARLLIDRHARAEHWRVPEHYDADWRVDRDYAGDPMFRPAGTTPGHALEWSRLLVQLWHLGGQRESWLREAAEALFLRTVEIGWDRRAGGFYYTLHWSDRPDREDRFWWPCAEGIGAAHVLRHSGGDARFEAGIAGYGTSSPIIFSIAPTAAGLPSSTATCARSSGCSAASPTSITRCRPASFRSCRRRPASRAACAPRPAVSSSRTEAQDFFRKVELPLLGGVHPTIPWLALFPDALP